VIARIRSAGLVEHDALCRLHRASSMIWEEDRDTLEAHPDAFGVPVRAIAEGRVRVALGTEGELRGFSVVADGGAGICVLDDLFVDPEILRRGVGRALVEDAAARASAAGSRAMTVIAHPRNFPFYESVSFQPHEPAATRFGPATRMRRELPR